MQMLYFNQVIEQNRGRGFLSKKWSELQNKRHRPQELQIAAGVPQKSNH
jgi:hypothetical protein